MSLRPFFPEGCPYKKRLKDGDDLEVLPPGKIGGV